MIKDKKYVWVFLAWSIICFIGFLQFALAYYFETEEITVYQVIIYPLIRFISGLIMIALVIIPGYKYLVKQKMATRVIGFIFLALFYCMAYLCLFIVMYDLLANEVTTREFAPRMTENALRSFSYIVTYFFMAIAILFTFDHLDSKVKAIEKQKNAENLLADARVQILKNQLQPHFLFNALNSVVSIIPHKKEQAQDMLVDISDLLRASLYNDLAVPVPIKEELETLNLFVSIEKKRYDDQLEVEFNIENQAYDDLILPFALQPMVENAIKHGFKNYQKTLKIVVEINSTLQLLTIIVKNNGNPLAKVIKEGIGLSNLNERLKNYYNEKFELDIYQSEGWVYNKIEIKKG